MLNKTLTLMAGLMIIAGMILLSGCAEENDSSKISTVDKVIAQIADSVADQIVDAEFASIDMSTRDLVAIEDVEVDIFNDMIVVDSLLYAVFNGGVVVYDFSTGTFNAIGAGEDINAIAIYDNQIYAGGKNLFRVVDSKMGPVTIGEDNSFKPVNPALEKIQVHFKDGINRLEPFGKNLYIGTNSGLYAYDGQLLQPLRDDWTVTAMASDGEGLWVGTDGNGLFRMFDDGSFKIRFLIRDTTIFDNVNCLDFSKGHLYAGTDEALYIFDGGKWETLTIEDGLPSDNILSVNADDWLVYVGTARGVTSYFDGDFIPVKNVDKMIANAFARYNNQMIVGTNDAVLLSSRHQFDTLIESDLIDTREPAFVEEILDTITPAMEDIIGPPVVVVEPDGIEEVDSLDEYQTATLDNSGLDTIQKILSLNEVVEIDQPVDSEIVIEINDLENDEQILTQSGSGL